MRIAGIVAEYNPPHSGHRFLTDAARKDGATHIVAVMGGSFVQRGEPAILPKWTRARAAVEGGLADLVLELPLPYAVSSAGQFAYGAVASLSALGVCDMLAFGSECGDAAALVELAAVSDDPAFSAEIKNELAAGKSYAAAREKAAAALLGAEKAALLSTPNNLLAVEYLTQLRAQGCAMTPFTVQRAGCAHDEGCCCGGFAPASLLRARLLLGETTDDFVPPQAASILREAIGNGLLARPERLELPLLARLRTMTTAELAALPDVSEGLENRLRTAIVSAHSVSELLNAAKTKRYAHSRLRRILLAALLGLSPQDAHTPPPYLRVLAMNARGQEILAAAKGKALLPVSHSLAELKRTGDAAARFALLEARAGDLYGLVTDTKQPCDADYTTPAVRCETEMGQTP